MNLLGLLNITGGDERLALSCTDLKHSRPSYAPIEALY